MQNNDHLRATSNSSQNKLSPSPFDLNSHDQSEHLRSVLLIIAVGIGLCILLLYFFGPQWIDSIMNESEGNYVEIAVAIFLTLIIASIVSGILRIIFKSITYVVGSSEEVKSKNTLFRIVSGVIFLILTIVLFNYVLSFLSQNQFFTEMEKYLEEGIQIQTEDGDKTIKLENGKFSIESPAAE